MTVVFEATTIEALARALVDHEAKPGQTAKIARVLQRIKGIPSAELKEMVSQAKAQRRKEDS
jgi:hypothetical protein